MSKVGPRPQATQHDGLYATKITGYMTLHRVKPVMTGLANISGARVESDTEEKMLR